MIVPAAARIEASGVRRSCETDSRSALLRASLRAGDLGLPRGRHQAILVDRLPDLVGDRGEESRLGGVRLAVAALPHGPE